MNTATLISWQSFKNKLQEHPELTLQFQYANQQWVAASYHITEIKQASITAVDCGGVKEEWTEVIVQLWEPAQKDSERAMKVKKALSIVALVAKSLPLNPLAIVKIEFGNSQFDTRQMYPSEFVLDGDNLIVNLIPDATQCKALGRGQECGTSAAPQVKPAVPLVQFGGTGPTCDPEAGCC